MITRFYQKIKQTRPTNIKALTVYKNILTNVNYFCAMRKLSMDELNRKTVDEFKKSEKKPVMIVLDNIRSMHNVGSVFRTADAFLINGIYLCGFTPQPPHRDINKTAFMNEFGGNWTENKIEILVEYAQAYLTIMNSFATQYKWKLLYFDGFAGSYCRCNYYK